MIKFLRETREVPVWLIVGVCLIITARIAEVFLTA